MKLPTILSRCFSEYAVSQLSAKFTIVLLIPVYEFVIYPFFRRYVLRILRRIGLGMAIALVGTIGMLVMDALGHNLQESEARGHCLLFRDDFDHPGLDFTPGFLIPLIFIISLGEMLIFVPSKFTV